MRFTDSTVLVSGAAGGMGECHARAFLAEGARVVLGDVRDDDGEALAQELGPNALYAHLDVTSAGDWQAATAAAQDRFGPVDVLVNNAGVFGTGGTQDVSLERFRLVLDVNLVGTLLGMQAVIPSMRGRGRGSIVNIASTAGMVGFPGLAAYTASKWAVRGLSRSTALELGGTGVRVNSVYPGPVRTPMMADADDSSAAHQAVPRLAEPEEVSRLVLFLASEDASYCTGSEFVADGGQVMGQTAGPR